MTTRRTSAAEVWFVALNLPLLLTVGPLWAGYVLSQLWTWFVAPTFELPTLTWPVAYGMALILSLASPSPQTKSEEKEPIAVVVEGWMLTIGRPLLFLVFGWIVSRFV